MDWQAQARAVGIIDIIFGGLAVVGGLIAWIAVQTGLGIAANESGEEWLMGLGAMVGIIIMLGVLVVAVPTVMAGIGILKGQEWGRILGMVVAVLWLLTVFAGNLLGLVGIYMLIVLIQVGNLGDQQQQQQTVVVLDD